MVRYAGALSEPSKMPDPGRCDRYTCRMVTTTSGLEPSALAREKLVRIPAPGNPELPALMLPLSCTRAEPASEVAIAKAVPKSCCDPRAKDSPSPAESSRPPVVWLKRADTESDSGVEAFRGLSSGRNRNTGRVACEVRRTHFQSSVIRVPGAAGALVTPMLL